MQKWRREKPPYDGDTPDKHRPMPYTAKEYGIALDCLIKFAEETIKAQAFFAGLNAASESFKNVKKTAYSPSPNTKE